MAVNILAIAVAAAAVRALPAHRPSAAARTPLGCLSGGRASIVALADSDEDGYGLLGSAIRQGPLPAFQRIAFPQKYEASVQKFMAEKRCSRKEAQGNIDAYLADPDSYALNELRSRKPGGPPVPDYANVNTDPKQIALTSVWALIVFAIAGRIIQVYVANPYPGP